MFKTGEIIVHNKMGLCTIKEITEFNGIEYYVLISNIDDTKIMIPKANSSKLIRKIITKQEIEELVTRIPKIEVESIYDFKARAKKYEELLKSGETEKLVILLKMIYKHKKENKNLTVADKEISKAAEKLLFDELGYVLNLNSNEVEKYLFKAAN